MLVEYDRTRFKSCWPRLHGSLGHSEDEVLSGIFQDLQWEAISEWQKVSVLVTLSAVLVLVLGLVIEVRWSIRRRKRRRIVDYQFANPASTKPAVRRVKRDSMEEQAAQLLKAIYDLAEGNPRQWVAVAEAAERADIPSTAKDYFPSFQYLKQSGLITTDNLVFDEVCKLTPKGIRAMEQVASSTAPSNSMHSPKG
jgi:hypothetical protein